MREWCGGFVQVGVKFERVGFVKQRVQYTDDYFQQRYREMGTWRKRPREDCSKKSLTMTFSSTASISERRSDCFETVPEAAYCSSLDRGGEVVQDCGGFRIWISLNVLSIHSEIKPSA